MRLKRRTCFRKFCAFRVGLLVAMLCISVKLVYPEQLPLKLYTTADGLARDGINRIVRDSHGFLWFATPEGVSRFDGYQFTNYTADQGLPRGAVNDVLETRSGDFWIATSDGIYRLNPRGVPQPSVSVAELRRVTTSDSSRSRQRAAVYRLPSIGRQTLELRESNWKWVKLVKRLRGCQLI